MSSKARAMPAAKNGLESTGTGRTEVHPDGCDCRRCRRTRAAQAQIRSAAIYATFGDADGPDHRQAG